MIPRKGAERDAAATNARIDRELTACMLAAQAGDERAYRRVLTAAGRHAARVARKGLRGFSLPTEDVEDIVQETLLALHAARGRWRSEAGVLAWVGAIARHKTIDAIRIACARQTTPIETEEAWLEDAGREPPGTG